MTDLQKKNIEFYDFINDCFKIKKAKRWSDISQNITEERISETYKFFSNLFPLNQDYSELLKSESINFKSIHYNFLKPNNIINEVVRYSLYSDEICVFHPIQNPSITNPQHNPIEQPIYWFQNFIDSLYFYIVLEKWVRQGIVTLIVNPYDFDLDLREKLDSKAKQRVGELLANPKYQKSLMEEAQDNIAELLAPSYQDNNIQEIINNLLEMNNPRFTEQEAKTFAKKIISKRTLLNPLFDGLKINFRQNSIVTTRGGGNLESILYVSDLLNANPYTTNPSKWYQIKELDSINFWTKVAHLYSNIDLPFLDNVDTSFALNIREEDRLSGVRKELRKIYNTVSTINAGDINEVLLRDLNGSFLEELKKADAEWEFIKKDAQNKRTYWAGTSVGLPIVLNEVSIIPIALGSAFWLGSNMRDEFLKLKKLRKTNPLSVFVDLKHNEPSFFSELKNCIF